MLYSKTFAWMSSWPIALLIGNPLTTEKILSSVIGRKSPFTFLGKSELTSEGGKKLVRQLPILVTNCYYLPIASYQYQLLLIP